jgi:hypothetical protein
LDNNTVELETLALVLRQKLAQAVLANAELEALILELKKKLAQYEPEDK